MLCLLVPFYSIYYLFMVCDAFYIRALAASLLLVFGVDAVIFLKAVWVEVYDSITKWLAQED